MMCERLPFFFFELIGQFQLILLRAGQHGFDLLETILVLCHILQTGDTNLIFSHPQRFFLSHPFSLSSRHIQTLSQDTQASRCKSPFGVIFHSVGSAKRDDAGSVFVTITVCLIVVREAGCKWATAFKSVWNGDFLNPNCAFVSHEINQTATLT